MKSNPTEHPPAPGPSADGPINHTMTVSEINRRHPECLAVFNKYGMGGCGGDYGPPEPLVIFAAAHHVPVRQLVEELNQAVRGEWKDTGQPNEPAPATEESAEQGESLYKRFIFAALIFGLTSGTAWGVINLTRIAWHQSWYAISGAVKQAHGHEQIFGWVGLFIMGVALHAVPRFKMQPLRPLWAAKLCFVLMVAGVLFRAVSQPWAAIPLVGVVLVVSALFELAAIGLFAFLMARIFLRSDRKPEFPEKYIGASVLWFVALGVWNLVLAVRMAATGSNTVPGLANALFVHTALFGFIANMIFGFSFRILPHFLGLRPTRIWAANTAFWLWNGALLLRYPIEQLAWIASLLELAAILLVIHGLGLWARRQVRIEIPGVDPAFAWFIHLAYGWLLAVGLLPLHADIFRLTASTRHALAVGFITSIIVGIAHRVLPIFNGVNLYSSRAMRISFWLLAAGSTVAVAMALSAVYETTWSFAWAAAAGWLTLGAIVVFSWNITCTLRARAETFTRDSLVTPTTRIADLLEAWPDLRPVLIHNGLAGLAHLRGSPPRFVTIEFAARRHGFDPKPLIELINQEIQKRRTTPP